MLGKEGHISLKVHTAFGSLDDTSRHTEEKE